MEEQPALNMNVEETKSGAIAKKLMLLRCSNVCYCSVFTYEEF